MADIVVFHSVLGLRPAELEFAERLREAGHRVTTPDLYDGRTTPAIDEGFALMRAVGWETISGRALDAVRDLPAATVLVGVSMGAGVVEDVLPRRPDAAAAVLLHAVGNLPTGLRAGFPVQVHVADPDPTTPPAQLAAWQAAATRSGADAEVFRYPGAGHFYLDAHGPEHDAPAAELTRERVAEFLRRTEPGSA
ncbi:dienelactone hydrolase family protein [Amycolatopsis sp. OK19-0408]|uniref:Dienelactone hydrolase family protein n=1 Tax=Amycolatopsis iheyensis TaxID=2945988 RepID=A0A9X2NET2_9PSEU|nr:dienelactone hydrolase family protein [Amycolatopsis iheyensis]MCR6485976.1 dienelactone hydrolase family protein [Amycolatopsis iheyensis]